MKGKNLMQQPPVLKYENWASADNSASAADCGEWAVYTAWGKPAI